MKKIKQTTTIVRTDIPPWGTLQDTLSVITFDLKTKKRKKESILKDLYNKLLMSYTRGTIDYEKDKITEMDFITDQITIERTYEVIEIDELPF